MKYFQLFVNVATENRKEITFFFFFCIFFLYLIYMKRNFETVKMQ